MTKKYININIYLSSYIQLIYLHQSEPEKIGIHAWNVRDSTSPNLRQIFHRTCFTCPFHCTFIQPSGMWQRYTTGSPAKVCLHRQIHTESVEQVGHRTVSATARRRNVPLRKVKVLIMLLLDQTGLFNTKGFHVRIWFYYMSYFQSHRVSHTHHSI